MLTFLIAFIVLVFVLSLEVLISSFFSKKALKEEDEVQFTFPYKISTCKSSKIFNIISMVLILVVTITLDIEIVCDNTIDNAFIYLADIVLVAILIAHVISLFKNFNLYFIVDEETLTIHTKINESKMKYDDIKYTTCDGGILIRKKEDNFTFLIPETFVGVSHLRKLLVSNETDIISLDEAKQIIEELK